MNSLDNIRPARAANNIVSVLKQTGMYALPLDVPAVAMELSRVKSPSSPIVRIKGAEIPGFEGRLAPQRGGWGIFYNIGTTSRGRINFTIAHEFGHYELHRELSPEGIECREEDLANWESDYGKMESQANEFAATLLMPYDIFRAKIPAMERPDLSRLWEVASHFDVSLMAATLRWLQYTGRRSMLVVSVEGFVLWARSSRVAYKTGLYCKTRNCPPVELPAGSLAAQANFLSSVQQTRECDQNVWFEECCKEHSLHPEGYEFVITLLHFDDVEPETHSEEEESLLDPLTDRFGSRAS